MPAQATDFYRTHLASLHRQLLRHPVTQNYLSGSAIRFDGKVLVEADTFYLPFCSLSTLELAHLFSIFNGSRVHVQAQHCHGRDEAPPGLYVNVINTEVISGPHKNRAGIFVEETETAGLFIDGLHIDHFFLNEYVTPPMLGTVAFALCAMTAYRAGLKTISLVAAGGKGFNKHHIGFKVWPKLGFDADLLPGEVDGIAHLQDCRTVQDVVRRDSGWWERNGSQRLMRFDLHPLPGTSWQKLLPYLRARIYFGVHHG